MSDLEPISDDLAEFLAADQEAPVHPSSRREAIRLNIEKRVALNADLAGTDLRDAPLGNAALRNAAVSPALMFGAGSLFGAALIGALWSMQSAPVLDEGEASTPPPAVVEPQPEPAEVEPELPLPSESEVVSDEHTDRAPVVSTMAVQRRTPMAARPVTQNDLSRELLLIDAARSALAAGNHQAAQAALDRHAEEFSDGQLASEREQLRQRVRR